MEVLIFKVSAICLAPSAEKFTPVRESKLKRFDDGITRQIQTLNHFVMFQTLHKEFNTAVTESI
jgi:hypothetical protein